MPSSSRRRFLRNVALGAASLSVTSSSLGVASSLPPRVLNVPEPDPTPSRPDLFFKIALSQFSFASQFWTKKLDPLDFPAKSKELGITGLDYCSMFYVGKARDTAYLAEL